MDKTVFLGGACGRTTWRRDIAIPLLQAAGVGFHDPQLAPGEWTQAHEAADIAAKNNAEVLLFVIHEETRGVASVGEVSYLLGLGRPLALAVRMIPDDTDWVASAAERDDLNRGRIFVRTMAMRRGVPGFERIEDAAEHAIRLIRGSQRVRSILADIDCGGLRFAAEAVAGGFHIRVLGPEGMNGRRWYVTAGADESELVRTAFKGVVTWQEHEAREMFRYKGAAVFGPHIDVNDLLRIAHP